jgi:AbrB family looped-hinge helix DNA binding protein
MLSSDRWIPVNAFMSVKGQIVIPSEIRRKLGIKDRTRVRVEIDQATYRIILTPVTRNYIHSLRGKYKGKGLLTALAAEKNCERDA